MYNGKIATPASSSTSCRCTGGSSVRTWSVRSGVTTLRPFDNVHLPEPMQQCEARSVGSAGMPRFSTYLELANSPRTIPGYDLIRRDESLGERTLKNTSISSFGSWSKADEYVSSSTLRSGNAPINLLSRGAINRKGWHDSYRVTRALPARPARRVYRTRGIPSQGQ